MKRKFIHYSGLSTVNEKRKENEEEFPVESFGARKVKDERELTAGQKQPLLLKLLRGIGNEEHLERCPSNNFYQGSCIPE